MPLIFIHGVSVREGSRYEKEVAFRDRNFIDIFYRELGRPSIPPEHIINLYWGDVAATISPDNPFLPKGGYESLWEKKRKSVRSFLAATDLVDSDSASPLLDLAKEHSLPEVIDLIWDMAAEQKLEEEGNTQEAASQLALSAGEALQFANEINVEEWLSKIKTDEELIALLEGAVQKRTVKFPITKACWAAVKSAAQGVKKLPKAAGVIKDKSAEVKRKVVEQMKTTGSRVASRVSSAQHAAVESMVNTHEKNRTRAAALAAKLVFDPLRVFFHDRFTFLIGDAFCYFGNRGTLSQPGTIPERVIEAINRANEMRTAEDPDVIVIAHSMGGNIICDVLSAFAPNANIDWLVTVGSQFPLFADLQMFPGLGGERPYPLPSGVKHWINVFDPNDLLGYPASHLFAGIDDFFLATGHIGAKAHEDYFCRRSFYRHLARRIAETT